MGADRRRGTGLTPEEARAFYDRFGRKQDLQAVYEHPALRELCRHADFGTAQAVFEFGCGTGRFAERLLRSDLPREARYRGVDISSTMVRLARRRLEPWGDRAEVDLTGKTVHVEAGPGAYDRFVSTYVLEILPEEEIPAVFAEAHRVLVPGGRLALVSLTWGRTPFTRLVSWGWQWVFERRPGLVGGCRSIQLLAYVNGTWWEVKYHTVVSAFGLSSEVLIASPRAVHAAANGV